ncbi:response regulator [Marinifilum sp. D737]|jgi:CheY-like chemotaxis protein|uniref:response regulator n=1 Tax=Marinifilum sp. D737 TaxID=2969628 RepID=UPI0022722E03|nr:response regulator [Marinifilum sp. D737]MCY1634408.1 response regulator [Marinifilum sp. D737]
MNFSSEYNWEGKVLLVAEDEDFNYIFLEEVLTDTNARLIRARDGEEAIRIFESNPEIDLVLMDMQMPIMNGYDATRNIKKLNQQIPVIAQTAYHYGEAYEEIMAAGCDDFVTKPIDINGLKDVIARFI